jgi:hypothetical protein
VFLFFLFLFLFFFEGPKHGWISAMALPPPPQDLVYLANPLVTVDQLENSVLQEDGIPADLERSLRYHGALLTQAAGILLKLPQEVIAQAIVTLQRFYLGDEDGSYRNCSLKVCYDFEYIYVYMPTLLTVI